MATNTDTGAMTLAELARRKDPSGKLMDIVEVMSAENAILDDIPWQEGNLETGHKMLERTALITPTWRRYGEGVAATKTRTAPFEETCGMLEDYSKCDVDLANLGGNPAAARLSEAKGKLESFAQETATGLFYHSTNATPQKIHGLAARYPATTGYKSSGYVLKGTNAGVNCHSLWAISWGPEKVFGIYPKGSKLGLQHNDKGEQLVTEADGSMSRWYVDHFKWDMGFAVQDYRYVVRYQWDPDDVDMAADKKGLLIAIQRMLNTIKNPENAIIYANPTTLMRLDDQRLNASVGDMGEIVINGRRLRTFMGTPLRRCDALVAESAIA